MKRRRPNQVKGALEWIEEATHLLRTSPAAVLAAYYIGALPFVLGLLFFWADMSRSPFAKEHVVEAALGMAVLFLWMKTWQAIFCVRLRALLAGEPIEALSGRRCLRVFVAQATLQPAGLLLIPIALVLTLPFAWVYGFYQNATALAEPGIGDGQSLFRRSAFFTKFWAGQYHVILIVLSGFAGVVFLNWTVVCLALPSLLKTLLGMETVFSRSPMAMLNTTFFAAMGGLTYLCVDPIVKALHVLRCFRGEAQTTGDDLKSELRQVAMASRQLAIMVAILVVVSGGQVRGAADLPSALPHYKPQTQRVGLTRSLDVKRTPEPTPSPLQGGEREAGYETKQRLAAHKTGEYIVHATEPLDDSEKSLSVASPVAKAAPLPSQQLDKTIDEVINQQKYTWRMPREEMAKKEREEKGYFAKLFERAGETVRKWARAAGDWLEKLFNKESSRSSPTPSRSGSVGSGFAAGSRLLLYVLIALAVVALGYLLYRLWRNRRLEQEIVEASPIQPVPDLADENVGAEQLPEDEWTRLARELLAKGEFRLALRAYYLSSLAYLAQRQLITLAKFKSNRDYERELLRRGHALADIPTMFAANVSEFDRVWYGNHAVDGEIVGRFASNVERIRSTA